ncbi:MAG: PQQ-binding-like beta-propeller repeat protein [Verrucomicrobia bacterium]|nr:PQQ-binding-like beta-propeller repeat protein [Verrucomicrobiota bacterium]
MDPQRGHIRKSHDFGAPVTGTVAIESERIFVAARNGNLYALGA